MRVMPAFIVRLIGGHRARLVTRLFIRITMLAYHSSWRTSGIARTCHSAQTSMRGAMMVIKEVFAQVRVRNAAKVIEFSRQALGAKEKYRLTEPSGRIGHVELDFGGHIIMFSDEYPEYGCVGPETIGGTSITLHLHVDDCDQMIERAISAGATMVREPSDQFYGERSGKIRDPFGHEWNIGHEIEQLTPEEMQRRYTELMTQAA